MAVAATRSSSNTTIVIGSITAEIGLFATIADASKTKTATFETAGPNGGRLKMEALPVEVAMEDQPDEQPVVGSPLDGVMQDLGAQLRDSVPEEFRPAPAPLVAAEIRTRMVEEGSDQVVTAADTRRGVFIGEGEDERFVDVTDQLAAIDERTKLDRIEVVATIDSTVVRRSRVIGAHFIGPQDDAAAPVLRLLYEGLKGERKAAVAKYTTRGRQKLGVIVADGTTKALVMLQIAFSEDVRAVPKKVSAVQKAVVSEQQVELMRGLLRAFSDTPDVLDTLADDAIKLRAELKSRALAGEMDVAVVEPIVTPDPEVDLLAALEASLAAAGRKV